MKHFSFKTRLSVVSFKTLLAHVPIKALLLSVVAMLAVGCSDDDYITPERADFMGSWVKSFADDRIEADGFEILNLMADGTCTVECYTAFPQPDGTDTFYYRGYWAFENTHGRLLLKVTVGLDNQPTEDTNPISYELEVFKFKKDSFHGKGNNSMAELIFRRKSNLDNR